MATTSRTTQVGLMVGVIGFASVAVFYAAFDLLAARGGLYTVDMLGKAVFRGLRDPAVLGLPMLRDYGAIILYSALHLAISVAIGLFVTWLVDLAQRQPARSSLVLLVLLSGFVVTIVVVGLLTSAIRALLPAWSIVLANVLAVLFAGAYLTRKRPGIWRWLSPFGG